MAKGFDGLVQDNLPPLSSFSDFFSIDEIVMLARESVRVQSNDKLQSVLQVQ